MQIIIIGCGRIGALLAYSMYKRGHQVSVVDENVASFNNLPPDFKGRIQEGNALNQEVLIRAGIETCDGLAAVTNVDTLNAAICHIAQTEYRIANVVARNYDPHLRPLFETFKIQVVSSTSWGSQRIEELLQDTEGRTIFSAGNGEVEVYEIEIPAPWNGRSIQELITCGECKWIAITRAGKAFLPDVDTILNTGDILVVAATMEGIQDTRANLRSRQEV
jgi:trk system potassium uptake protein TrkA